MIAVNDGYPQTAPDSPVIKSMALVPVRHNCLEILKLSALEVNPQTSSITYYNTPEHIQMLGDYEEIAGWLQGYYTAWNIFVPKSHGNLTGETRPVQWMAWIFDYCRAHPAAGLTEAAASLGNALLKDIKNPMR